MRNRAGGGPMRFYNQQHRHYCGIDLHVKTMYVCILDEAGHVLVHRNVKSTPEAFREIVAPFRDDLVVAAECMFTWYWLADVCAAGGNRSARRVQTQYILASLRSEEHTSELQSQSKIVCRLLPAKT